MPSPLRILHLHSSFNLGGKEARSVRLMNAFGDRASHTIVSGVAGAYDARDAIAKGIRYEIAQNPPPLTGKPSVARYEAIAKFMSRFDLILTYNWGAIDGVMAKRVFGKNMPPVIHHEDGFGADEAKSLNPVRNMYRRFALPVAHALVVPSLALERIARRNWHQPPERLHRISNGIPVAAYRRKPQANAIPGFARREGAVVIGTLARLSAVKDIPLLVRAFGGMITRAQLVIVGDGPERGAVETAIENMAAEDSVFLPGFLSEPHRFLGHFDIFALSSRSEQQPISVMEAMAAGLPVAAPPVGDVPHMVSAENQPFVSHDWNEVRLRDAMEALARDPALRKSVGAANRAKALESFDEGGMIAAYAALYSEAVGKPGALG